MCEIGNMSVTKSVSSDLKITLKILCEDFHIVDEETEAQSN